MARKKITPEEELPKTVTAESSETADGGDIVQAGPPTRQQRNSGSRRENIFCGGNRQGS